MNRNRRVKMQVSFKGLADLLRGGVIYSSNAPSDLKVVGVEQLIEDFWKETFFVYLESSMFDLIPEGSKIPEISSFVFKEIRNV
jgi:hypothetical protein